MDPNDVQQVDLIILGGGPAGVTAALRARELGAETVLVEKGQMGGTCTNDGCVPTRVLAKAARLMRESRQLDEYGLSAEPARLDFAKLIERTQEIVYRVHEKKQLVDHLETVGARVLVNSGSARFTDPHTVKLANGEKLQADRFIIAVGGRARRLHFPGSEHALTHSDVWRLRYLPPSVAIIGAAATGCQLASVFQTFGARVHLLELADRIVPGEDADTSTWVERGFRSQGMEIITGISGVERIERTQNGTRLHYRHGDSAHSIDVAAVIVAAGWIGNTESLGLDAASVRHHRSYIEVDDYLRTSQSHIFAAGDVTGRMMLVQSGSYEARIAAENAILGPSRAYSHQIVPHGSFTDPEYGSVGLSEADAGARWPVQSALVPYSDLDRAVIDGRTHGFCKLVVRTDSKQIVGAHVVGEQATEVVQLVAAGMAADLRIEALAELELAYPTFTAIVGLAARRLVHMLGKNHSPDRHPQWRALSREHFAEWERRQAS